MPGGRAGRCAARYRPRRLRNAEHDHQLRRVRQRLQHDEEQHAELQRHDVQLRELQGRPSNCSMTAPDLLGCECATPGCCAGNSCQTTHSNGVGQSFYDCLPLDTFNQTQALAACTAFTGNQAQCTGAGCLAPDGGPSGNVVCSSASPTDCVCWQYDAPFAGRYYNSGMPGNANCFCPGSINAFQWH